MYGLASALTSIPVTKEVSIDVMDVGVNGGTAGDAARGHVGIILWVNVLKALPWHTGAEFWGTRDNYDSKYLQLRTKTVNPNQQTVS